MKLIRGVLYNTSNSNEFTNGCVASIGNFDGLHLGHRQLLAHLIQKSNELKLPSTIISFEPLPAEFFRSPPPKRVYPLRDKIRLLKQLGIDYFINLRFNQHLANMDAKDFVQQVLLKQFKVHYLVVGDDFRFGKQRKGDFQLLRSMGSKAGMIVRDTPTCYNNDKRISSSRIREYLATGNIKASNRLLGSPYQLSGRVRHGNKRGRTIGFPTLNLRMPDTIAPAHGVYAVRITGLANKTLTGVASLGKNPTVAGKEVRLETYVFDYKENAYGKYVCIQLDKFLRPEQYFKSFDALKQQIDKDADTALQYYRQ